MTDTSEKEPVSLPDFDSIFETEETPLQLRLYGRLWELPPTIPARCVLRVADLQAQGKAEVDQLTKSDLLLISSDLIPKDILDVWLAKGITTEQLGEILQWAMQQYQARGAATP